MCVPYVCASEAVSGVPSLFGQATKAFLAKLPSCVCVCVCVRECKLVYACILVCERVYASVCVYPCV